MKKDNKKNNKSIMKTDSQGNKYWYNKNRQLHRTDGPAVELADGSKEWYLYGEQIHCSSNEEFLDIVLLRSFR